MLAWEWDLTARSKLRAILSQELDEGYAVSSLPPHLPPEKSKYPKWGTPHESIVFRILSPRSCLHNQLLWPSGPVWPQRPSVTMRKANYSPSSMWTERHKVVPGEDRWDWNSPTWHDQTQRKELFRMNPFDRPKSNCYHPGQYPAKLQPTVSLTPTKQSLL